MLTDTSSGGDDTFILNNPAPGFGLANLTVFTSTSGSGSTVQVDTTHADVTTDIVGGSLDTVSVGQNGILSGIAGLVNVTNPTSFTKLIIDDSKDTHAALCELFDDGLTYENSDITWNDERAQ